jgi:hypothetical protein
MNKMRPDGPPKSGIAGLAMTACAAVSRAGKAKWSLTANLIARQTSVKEISDKVTPQTILPVLKDKFPKTATSHVSFHQGRAL